MADKKEDKKEIGRILSGGETTGGKLTQNLKNILGLDDKEQEEKIRQKRIENLKKQVQNDEQLPTQRS